MPTAQRGSAHLQFESARLGGVADRAGRDADHLPQHDTADGGEAAAFGRSPVPDLTHAVKARSGPGVRRVERAACQTSSR